MVASYLDVEVTPQFPFGFGLSYTTFAYTDVRVSPDRVGLAQSFEVSAQVTNVGKRAGTEVVQLYVRDLVGNVTRPVKELKGFQRITLQPDEQRTVRFDVPAGELGYIGLDMRYAVEPGAFTVWVGPDSTSGLEGRFEVR